MTTAKQRPSLAPGEIRPHPVLPLRDIVVFPHMIAPLFVGRKKSVRALEEVMRTDSFILLATQKNASDDNPATDAIFEVGTLASVLQLLKLPDGTVKVLVEGVERAKILKYTDRADCYEADAVLLEDTIGERVEVEALARSVVAEFEAYVKVNKEVPPEVVGVVRQIDDYGRIADTVASHLIVKIPDKQAILEMTAVAERLEKVFGLMESEVSVLQIEKRIRTRVKRQTEKAQREYYLNEQMKAISRLAVVDPWGKKTKIKKNLNQAQRILDSDHHGLENIKERIVEYLAVQQRANKLTGPILCLVGPPGVGKTSFGKSIARAVLDPGRGRTKTGYFWAISRDDRPWAGSDPPGVAYTYAPGRGGEHLITLLAGYSGIVQCDGYAAYKQLVGPKHDGQVTLAFCWAHWRRQFYDITRSGPAPIAEEALERIAKLFAIEQRIRGSSAGQRQAVRQAESKPIVEDLKTWLEQKLVAVSQKSTIADAIRYGFNQWDGLVRFLEGWWH